MAFWLRSAERRVQARARKVQGDTVAVETAARRLRTGIRHELAKPKVLLAVFAAGLGLGWLRGGGRRDARSGDSVRSASAAEVQTTGRIARIVAAVLAGARIYEQARRAVAFMEEHGREKADMRRTPPSDDPFAPPATSAERADQDAFSCS